MKYPRLAALLALSVAALAPAGAAARFWDIQAPGVGYLNVVDGRPVLQKSSVVLEGDWNLSFPAEKTVFPSANRPSALTPLVCSARMKRCSPWACRHK